MNYSIQNIGGGLFNLKTKGLKYFKHQIKRQRGKEAKKETKG